VVSDDDSSASSVTATPSSSMNVRPAAMLRP
jgi:hypothetical protein